jgi:hypothetical protein
MTGQDYVMWKYGTFKIQWDEVQREMLAGKTSGYVSTRKVGIFTWAQGKFMNLPCAQVAWVDGDPKPSIR